MTVPCGPSRPAIRPGPRRSGNRRDREDETAPTQALGDQLAGLDEALAAIEAATHTLERSYANEIAAPEGSPERSGGAGDERPPG